jgi:hypothetical protein
MRAQKTTKLLELINAWPSEEQKQNLGGEITTDEVDKALKAAENGSAPGADGFSYKIWKHFNKIDLLKSDSNIKRSFSIVDMLTLLFNDIWQYGVATPKFAEGWMCPLYKKGNREEIANFQPITCLNIDYKLFTKVLATRISKVAPTLIHLAQAGFIPERQISDHTQLTCMVIEYAELTGTNGLIVALDQEKVYNKIAHNYLWKVLDKFEIPRSFANAARSLYENAETRVCINGVFSDPWTISQGVRQGNPLLCILFDLAIEPLSLALRKSSLKGYNIPGQAERLITTQRIQEYLWDGKMSKLNKAMTQAPIEAGGLKVLDIEARNEAIRLIWLKRYLNMTTDRPTWAFFADTLFAKNVPLSKGRVDRDMRENIFTQTWKTFRGRQRSVSPFLRDLMETAKTYQLRLEAVEIKSKIADSMPIWLHKEANARA